MMQVLVVGGGGREHALLWKIAQSDLVRERWAAPGNAGMARIATCVAIDPSAIVEIADFVEDMKIDLTVVGPELPLTLGIADEFERRGLKLFGPTRAASEIEASKAFAKEFMERHRIPTARFTICSSSREARKCLAEFGEGAVVVKADGLAQGKGVVVAADRAEALRAIEDIMVRRRFGTAGRRVVVEEALSGTEITVFALCDGENLLPLASSQDFKRAGESDNGPNTGGMGAISPTVHLDADDQARILTSILQPTVRGLAEEGRTFRGVLYAGLILTSEGPKVIEFNCRFGDPETQAVLPRMEGDLVPVLWSCLEGNLAATGIEWTKAACATVVAAAKGYPDRYETGAEIRGLREAEEVPGAIVFHAGTEERDGRVVTAGGRVLNVSGLASSLRGARDTAYEALSRISYDGMVYRRDIGERQVQMLEAGA